MKNSISHFFTVMLAVSVELQTNGCEVQIIRLLCASDYFVQRTNEVKKKELLQ